MSSSQLSVPVEEAKVEIGLQLPDQCADRRLRGAELVGGERELPEIGHGYEGPKLLQRNVHLVPIHSVIGLINIIVPIVY